ncbi:Homeodomain-like domain-containing protein [Actinokineospora auranticolor]|uniref:Homeodomain-like domain-containing protein n=1 Tax=Actinokineospora auranticolor TaxID=155976 RepID=A0A2S6GBH0_9PSEU|nr:Homeodomain-like domain-containing protein [Actinokineospora auranticolor]
MVRRKVERGGPRPSIDVRHADVPGATTRVRPLVESLAEAEADEEFFDDQALRAAESLRQRESDLVLYNELALEGFEGRAWDRFAYELARYGYAVMMAWLKSGELFAQCKAKNCWPGSPPERWDDPDDRAGLAGDTVTTAIAAFKERALIAGGWTFDGGASLKTYFIGRCVFAFPNHYRKWATEQLNARLVRAAGPDTDSRGHDGYVVDPAERALTKLRITAGIAAIPDERTRAAVILQEAGYTYPEIAELLDVTPKAVDGILQRQRTRGQTSPARRTS